MTVANVKGIYNDILTYFATRQDKLFILSKRQCESRRFHNFYTPLTLSLISGEASGLEAKEICILFLSFSLPIPASFFG